MSLHIDSLADLVRGAVSGGDITREDFERALDQVNLESVLLGAARIRKKDTARCPRAVR